MVSLLVFFLLFSAAAAGALYGQIKDVPDVVQGDAPGRNGLSYQSRIRVELQSLHHTQQLLVDREFRFHAADLSEGVYQLTVDSYDFELKNHRWQVEVSGESETAAVEFPVGKPLNASSRVLIDAQSPLNVKIVGTTQYFENLEGGLSKMLFDSPFGFIFRNRTYTIIFVMCLATMAMPYLLQLVSPELADQINERQPKYAAQKEVEVLSKPAGPKVRQAEKEGMQTLGESAPRVQKVGKRTHTQGSTRRA